MIVDIALKVIFWHFLNPLTNLSISEHNMEFFPSSAQNEIKCYLWKQKIIEGFKYWIFRAQRSLLGSILVAS